MSVVTAVPRLDQRGKSEGPARPTDWRRLGRVTWLQHRAAFFSIFVLFVAFVVAMVVEESRANGSYASYVTDGCVAHALTRATTCNADALALGGSADFRGIGLALGVLPLLVGVFIGAPLIARELESGTFCFAWTQGTDRTRFVLAKFAVLALAVCVMAVVLGLIFGGSYAHLYEVVIGADVSQWQATLFTTTWWMLAAWVLVALAIGTVLGATVKRTVAAMAATAGIVGGLIVAAHLLLPQLLGIGSLASSRFSVNELGIGPINTQAQMGSGAPAGSWLVRSWLTGPGGKVLGTMATQNVGSEYRNAAGGGTEAQWLALHHYAFWTSYQPASHFWVVQGVMGVVLIALAAGCVALALRSVRARRA